MKAVELADKSRILAFLEADRLYAAYAVGDLEPELFVRCKRFGAKQDGRLLALVLHYTGLGFPVVFLMGDGGGLRAIFEDALYIEEAYFTCRGEHLGVMQDFYNWAPIPTWRMALGADRFRPIDGDCAPLTPDHTRQLAALYAHGERNAFDLKQVLGGAFYGVFEDGQLVAAAGTHLISPTYGVAAVGNVFTHPDFRGRGYAPQPRAPSWPISCLKVYATSCSTSTRRTRRPSASTSGWVSSDIVLSLREAPCGRGDAFPEFLYVT
jgi:hypothetical protein